MAPDRQRAARPRRTVPGDPMRSEALARCEPTIVGRDQADVDAALDRRLDSCHCWPRCCWTSVWRRSSRTAAGLIRWSSGCSSVAPGTRMPPRKPNRVPLASGAAAIPHRHQPPRVCEQRDQLPPGIPVLRPPVQQQHRWPAPRLGDMDVQAPGVDVPVRHTRYLRHRSAAAPGLRPCQDLAGALLDGHRPAFPRASRHQIRGGDAPKGSRRI